MSHSCTLLHPILSHIQIVLEYFFSWKSLGHFISGNMFEKVLVCLDKITVYLYFLSSR